MTFKELKRIVRKGENLHTEFKLKTYYPTKITKEVVAFANTEGGLLIVGVADDGRIAGLKNSEGDLYVLEKAFRKHCEPQIDYDLHRIEVNEREVLVFEIFPSKQKPVRLVKEKDEPGKAYVRIADKSVQASREMRQVMKGESKGWKIMLRYGDYERKLMHYLGKNKRIDVGTFAEIAEIRKRQASEILIRLTLAGVISILPQEGGNDFFEQRAENYA